MNAATDRAVVPGSAAIERFSRTGFIVVPGLASAKVVAFMRESAEADLAAMREPLEREADLNYPGAPANRQAPGGETIRRLLRVLDRDPAYARWALSDAVLGWIRALLGTPDIRLVQAHHNCVMTKHPRFSSATHWHQDIRYWSFRRNDLVNCWTALGHETRENGCMQIIPGSHRMKLSPERFDREKFFRPDLPENRELIDTAISCTLAPGDVLFFHSGALHAAGRNETDVRKLSAVFSYRAADNPPEPCTRSAAVAEMDPAGQTRIGPKE